MKILRTISMTIVAASLLVLPQMSHAYPDWASGCNNCHGDYNSGTYISLVDGQDWGVDLMAGHQDNLIGGNDCDVCHTSPGKSPVFLDMSDGGDGLDPISCLGCHGRDEGGAEGITGIGLQQHHFRTGNTICAVCHPNADPANFTPVGEEVMPPYYANPGIGHPNISTSPCNEAPGYTEDVLGVAGTGLDNDGDLDFDENDADCSGPSGIKYAAHSMELYQNYPNPFNPSTTIHFTLHKRSHVRLEIYAANGELIRTLVATDLSPDVYHKVWSGRDNNGAAVSSGVYFYRLQSNEGSITRKMVLLK